MPTMVALVLVLLLFLDGKLAWSGKEGQFDYHGFTAGNLTLDGSATVMPNGVLTLTNSINPPNGHAFHPMPLRFLQVSTTVMNTTVVARSFFTSFVFAIDDEYHGLSCDGLAFVVSPTTDFSTANRRQYLGLLNATNGTSDNRILAVELDTIMNTEFRDINSNHVGIDVNSLMSRQAKTAGYYNDEDGTFRDMTLSSREPMQVWVDYDNQAKQLNVTLAPMHVAKPKNPLLSEAIDLSTIMADTMYVGFSSSSGTLIAHHYILGWSFSLDRPALPLDFLKLPTLPRVDSKTQSKIFVIMLPLTTSLVVVALLVVIFVFYRRRFSEVREDWEYEFGPHRFAYKDLFHATNGFKSSNLVGVGGFGRVYKGVLPASNFEIAVKIVSHDSRQGLREFIAEVVSIGRLRHRNLAQLLGYCRRKGELILVYDYMKNGSLDKYLHNKNGPSLYWHQRYRVIKGVASSLLYLHEDWEQVVIHRDIKSSNVLLDNEMNGRLGDFGLARLYDHGTVARTTHVVGTMGYLAPELVRIGKATPLTDVFAFGVFLLEVTCGRRPFSMDENNDRIVLVDWVFEHQRNGSILDTVDPRLTGNFNTEEAILVLNLGLMCSHPSPSIRPSMRKVMQFLDGEHSVSNLSPTYKSDNTMGISQSEAAISHDLSAASFISGESSVTVLLEGR